jgi:hypothetical protein
MVALARRIHCTLFPKNKIKICHTSSAKEASSLTLFLYLPLFILPFTNHNHTKGSSTKRTRTETLNTQIDLQNVVNSQGAEIESLKSDKAVIENSHTRLRTEHDKVVYENRTLKRAVLIQQERQNQAVSEITAARQYKVEADDKIKKLEQIVLSLRYHLQAQQNNTPGNDFMGFTPPNVY